MDPSSLPPKVDLPIPAAATQPPPSVPLPSATATIANPSPPTLNQKSYPPYSEMIFAAITALNEKGGSSKRAIAKYIEKAYTNLPTNHSAMLTQHLKRLKNSGFLVMVKKSYKLPRSDAILPTNDVVVNNSNLNPTTAAATATTSTAGPSAHGPKTGRGRGRPRKSGTGSGSVVEKPKRGPGRPRKIDVSIPVQHGPKKRMAGRPRKPKTVKGRPVQVQVQTQDQLNPVTVSYAAADANVLVPVSAPVPGVPRPRGRPRKIGTSADAGGKQRGRPTKKLKSSTGRPVGRPKKNISSALTKAAEAQVQTIADLKRKLEYFQSKMKQAVGVLKPQLNSESQIGAVATIQELESLASIDINVPLREETQPEPQPQLQPQSQLQPQLQPPLVQS